MPNSKVFVNRTLNLKKIKYIGLDMDHTLIRYKTENFERLSHGKIIEKLIASKGYPEQIRNLQFDASFALRGLVVDRKKGNLLKLNRYTAIRTAFHGLKQIDYKTLQKMYRSTYIDLSKDDYAAVDTTFSYSFAMAFSQMVEFKDSNLQLKFPEYSQIADDVLNALDEAHRDGSLKNAVKENLNDYIIKDEKVVNALEKFKKHGKKIFILTNSEFYYTKLLLDFAINPFLKDHKSWVDLFEIVVTFAQKPKFFYDDLRFLKVDPSTGTMSNMEEKLKPGVYQGGNARKFTTDLSLDGDDILYIGDHIYGDILRLKKDCNWRTAMIIEELENEIDQNIKAEPLIAEIDRMMLQKEPLEDELTELMTLKYEKSAQTNEKRIDALQEQITEIDSQISQLIKKQLSFYNPNWGQLMRSGNEESYFAYQMERYACVYMSKVENLFELSPRTYFRAPRRPLSHEQ
jgi:HAD superfamily 5'-nucleotidase-like hydrolase